MTVRRFRAAALAAAASLVAGLLTVALAPAQTASAADMSTFDPGLIITDDAFYDSSTMSASDIEAFFKAKDPGCTSKTGYTCLKDFTMKTTTRAADGNCGTYTGKSSESAAAIMYRVSKVCGVNPQVMLVTLQKEQGFITGGPRSSAIYRKAMGYGCPDSSVCNSKYYGFFNQVYSMAWQFKQYRNHPARTYEAGKTLKIPYNPKSSCGGTDVYIRNQATAGLYNYTPYQPNAAALAAGSGTGDSCSSYGNRNFFRYFSDWFGNPANLLHNAGFERSSSGWVSGAKSVAISRKNSTDGAQAGAWYLSTSTDRAGSSLRQSVHRASKAGNVYSASVWLKSRDASVPFTGGVKLSAIGGKTEVASQSFSVGPEWTQVVVTLPITSTHDKFYLDIYENTKGVSLAVDTATVVKGELAPVRSPIALQNASFEGSSKGWSTVGKTSAVVRTKLAAWPAANGSSFLLAKTTTPSGTVQQSVPYRVVTGRSYTATAMVRTSSATPFTGSLILRGLGSSSDSSRTDFVANGQWQKVQVTYTATKPGVNALRLEVRMGTVNQYLHIDDIHLSPNLAADAAFDGGDLGGWQLGAGSPTVAIADGGDPHPTVPDYSKFAYVTRTSDSTASIRLDMPRPLQVGETYTASIWVRSGLPGTPITGSLRLWGLGATNEQQSTGFVTTDGWQLVTDTFTVTQPGNTTLRMEVFMNTPAGTLAIDGAWVR